MCLEGTSSIYDVTDNRCNRSTDLLKISENATSKCNSISQIHSEVLSVHEDMQTFDLELSKVTKILFIYKYVIYYLQLKLNLTEINKYISLNVGLITTNTHGLVI